MTDLRLWLAQFIAPPGADIHDPDETACPAERAVLEAAEQFTLYSDDAGRVGLDVTDTVRFAVESGWLRLNTDPDGNRAYQLTELGESVLDRRRTAAEGS